MVTAGVSVAASVQCSGSLIFKLQISFPPYVLFWPVWCQESLGVKWALLLWNRGGIRAPAPTFWAVFLSSKVKFPGCEPAQYLGYCHPLASANCFQQQSLLSSHCNIYWIAGPWSYTQICVNSFCLCITTVGVRRVRQEPGQKLSCFLPLTCWLWWIQRNCRVSCPALIHLFQWFHIFWACIPNKKICFGSFATSPWENLGTYWHFEGIFRRCEVFRKQNKPTKHL